MEAIYGKQDKLVTLLLLLNNNYYYYTSVPVANIFYRVKCGSVNQVVSKPSGTGNMFVRFDRVPLNRNKNGS